MISVVFSLLLSICLCIGFCAGYVVGGTKLEELKELQRSVLHPHRYIKKKMKEKREEKMIAEKIEYFNDVLFNIENYDGSGLGQRYVKRGDGN